MSNSPFVVILAVFDDEATAAQAYKDLHKAEKDKKLDLENTVLIHKDEEGKIHVKEEAERFSGEAGKGALVGGALGLLAGPVGFITLGAAGAILGGITAKLDDVGFDDTRLKMLGETLAEGKSAILAVLEGKYSEKLVEELKNRNARVAVEDLPKDFEQILDDGGSFAYRIAADEAQEAAVELGLIKPEFKDYVSGEQEPGADPSPEDDPNAAFPKL
ncbi:MAG: DUF1269 domain-containing protein [Anaerolineales bacterium]|nr:DUF1269 domain-containing protein [Anaerolineales bacterium]